MISPEKSPGPNHGKNYWGGQLSLDQLSSDSAKASFANMVHVITSGKIAFHPEGSEVGDNSFSLKISYKGRSYLLSGIYVRDQVRSPHGWDISASMVRIVRFDNILACRDGRYTVPVPHGKERETLQESVHTILSGHYNGTMH